MVGDHMGRPGAVCFVCLLFCFFAIWLSSFALCRSQRGVPSRLRTVAREPRVARGSSASSVRGRALGWYSDTRNVNSYQLIHVKELLLLASAFF